MLLFQNRLATREGIHKLNEPLRGLESGRKVRRPVRGMGVRNRPRREQGAARRCVSFEKEMRLKQGTNRKI